MDPLDSSTVLTPAALGDLAPVVQALYENAHGKLRDGHELLPSERVALEERLAELWETYGPADGEVVPPHYALVLVLDDARQAAGDPIEPWSARALLTWLVQAEELRARLELHTRLWQSESRDA